MKKMNKKGYAYGSMVRKPMYGGGMAMSANPMMDRKDKIGEVIGEICEMKNCNNCIFFEARKGKVISLQNDICKYKVFVWCTCPAFFKVNRLRK